MTRSTSVFSNDIQGLKERFAVRFEAVRRGINRLNGATIEYNLDTYQPTVQRIRALAPHYTAKSDQELRDLSLALRDRCRATRESECASLVEAFAIACEVIHRKLGLRPFDEQLLAGLVLNEDKLAQMQTGEGKTLSAVFPACFNALTGVGVQILTFNDYLAKRDAQWMEPVYTGLGISVDYVQQGMTPEQRRSAYAADVTYLTAKELGFDYLRDGLCYAVDDQVQRECGFTIVDEADSILIDEARIPLVLATSTESRETELWQIRDTVQQLEASTHLCFDEHRRNVNLSEAGIQQIEDRLALDNLYDEPHTETLVAIGYALHAEHLLQKGVDYLVRDGAIVLIDEFTGRIADNRRWPDGLHAAVEAKENLACQHAGVVQNAISLQHLLKLCPRLCGMSATCESSAEEFNDFYGLHTVVIPPHKHSRRVDHPDKIFIDREAKHQALINHIVEIHTSQRPVLVGTASVEESYHLHRSLQALGLEAEVLNADNDAEEAKIIAQAGRLGALTISTNMAGRGTDIILDGDNVLGGGGISGGSDAGGNQRVRSLGGLYVIGTNRHESPRIDRQLRGRAGRQGDPGSSRFFISLDDPLYQRFNFKDLLSRKSLEALSKTHQQEITTPWLSKKTQQIQRIIDGENHEIRKSLISYSHMIEQQRQVVRHYRRELCLGDAATKVFAHGDTQRFTELQLIMTEDALAEDCKTILLWCTDQQWRDHLGNATDLQDIVRLRVLGGNNPLHDFQKQVSQWFECFFDRVEQDALDKLTTLAVVDGHLDLDHAGIASPSSTWTYQKNDSLFDDMRGQLLSQSGFSAVAALMAGPLLLIALWLTRKRQQKS